VIDGVKRIPLPIYEDGRGYLFEVVHATDAFLPQFGQVYVVGDPAADVVRGMHMHRELIDLFCIVHGRALFILSDERPGSPTFKQIERVVLDGARPQLVVVPPLVLHGWKSLVADTVLLSTASHVYNREHPDEIRLPWDYCGAAVWDVEKK